MREQLEENAIALASKKDTDEKEELPETVSRPTSNEPFKLEIVKRRRAS